MIIFSDYNLRSTLKYFQEVCGSAIQDILQAILETT